MSQKILIKGAGEQASGTAHRLHRCGFRVVMTEQAWPTAVRLQVSFCTAIHDGEVVVEGVRGVGYAEGAWPDFDALDGSHVPVLVDPTGRVIERWRPDVIIDARLAKRNLDNHPGQAALVIGYGPGLVVGRDVDVVIETHRGHDLGRIVREGAALPDTGVPGTLGGHGASRVLRAPCAGVFRGLRAIGDRVVPGERIGEGAGQPLVTTVAGVLRGLIREGTEVLEGQKVGDVDPRGDPGCCDRLSDKSRTLSGAALEVILSHSPGGDR